MGLLVAVAALVVAWLLLSMVFAVVNLLFEHDPRTPPTRSTLLRAWLYVATRMAWLPFGLAPRTVRALVTWPRRRRRPRPQTRPRPRTPDQIPSDQN